MQRQEEFSYGIVCWRCIVLYWLSVVSQLLQLTRSFDVVLAWWICSRLTRRPAVNQIVSSVARLPHGAHLHPSDTIVYALGQWPAPSSHADLWGGSGGTRGRLSGPGHMGAPNPYQRLYDRVKCGVAVRVWRGAVRRRYLSTVHLATRRSSSVATTVICDLPQFPSKKSDNNNFQPATFLSSCDDFMENKKIPYTKMHMLLLLIMT